MAAIIRGERYKETINNLLNKIKATGLNIREFEPHNPPTQAFSQFVINKKQGDWAEKIILNAINTTFQDIIAVRYGRSDDIIAGEEGFREFYTEYQKELSEIGKRPDILIFNKTEYYKLKSTYSLPKDNDISMCSRYKLDKIVPHAIAGLEVRSSSFLVDKHIQYLEAEKQKILDHAFKIVMQMKTKLRSLPRSWEDWVRGINSINDLQTKLLELPRSPLRRNNTEVKDLILDLRSLRDEYRRLLGKHLSFTPKVEDLSLIKTWINTYGVPHYYVQVFFDRIYAISFVDILRKIINAIEDQRAINARIEEAPKNQFKETIYLNIDEGVHIGDVCENKCCPVNERCLPELKGEYKVLNDGRVIVAVDFVGGYAKLYEDRFRTLLGLGDGE